MSKYNFYSVEKLNINKLLPDPFINPEGKRIKSIKEWNMQRDYILNMMDHFMYGPNGPEVSKVSGKIISQTEMYGGKAIQEEVMLKCDKLYFRITLVRPNKSGKFPIITYAIMTPLITTAPAEWETVCEKGFSIARYDVNDIAYDKPEGGGPIYTAFPNWEGKAIMAWSWAIMRINDYLLGREFVDEEKLIVAGCSRFGKKALCTMIHDERIALAGILGSGCGGTGSYRVLGTRKGWTQDNSSNIETLGRVMCTFPHWFSENMLPFSNIQPPYPLKNEYRLPFDMHFARALVAPRPMIVTNALGDDWGNLYGDYVTYLAAQEVYDFLGASDKTAFFYREGPHAYGYSEWIALLDFADYQFYGKESEGLKEMNKPLYDSMPQHFTWKKPEINR